MASVIELFLPRQHTDNDMLRRVTVLLFSKQFLGARSFTVLFCFHQVLDVAREDRNKDVKIRSNRSNGFQPIILVSLSRHMDISVTFKCCRCSDSSEAVLETSSFLLSIFSPMFRAMFCGKFREQQQLVDGQMELGLVEARDLGRIFDMFCGKRLNVCLNEALHMAQVADQYGVSDVLASIEEALILHVRSSNCLQIADHECSGMPRLKDAAVKKASFWFKEVKSDVPSMSAGSIANLFRDPRLVAKSEEVVWAVAQEWVRQRIAKGCLSSDEFRLVAGSVRLPWMQTQSLKEVDSWVRACNIGADNAAWMGGMVKEALVARERRAAGPVTVEPIFAYLKAEAVQERIGKGVKWAEYTGVALGDSGPAQPVILWSTGAEGTRPNLSDEDEEKAKAVGIAVCNGKIVTATETATMAGARILNFEGQLVQTLSQHARESEDSNNDSDGEATITQVSAIAVYSKARVVITGHLDGAVREWDLNSGGECISTLRPTVAMTMIGAALHGRFARPDIMISKLAVWAFSNTTYLAVVFGTERYPGVWTRTGSANDRPAWIELDPFAVPTDSGCWCLAGWGDKLLGGMEDGAIRVWEFGTTAQVTVTGKTGFDAHKRNLPPRKPGSMQSARPGKNRFAAAVVQMLVRKERLLSSSLDSTIRVWILGTWVLTQQFDASDPGAHYESLIFSGTKLLGLERNSSSSPLVVWGLAEGRLQLEHRLDIPHGLSLDCLVAVDGQVWGAAGEDLMVWGQHALAVSSPSLSAPSLPSGLDSEAA